MPDVWFFPSLVCSQASWLLVYLPTLMEEGRRSRNSLWPGGMIKSDEPSSCIASEGCVAYVKDWEASLPRSAFLDWALKLAPVLAYIRKRVDLIFHSIFSTHHRTEISGFIHIEGRLGERRDALVYKESPSQRSTYQLPFILLGSWTKYSWLYM